MPNVINKVVYDGNTLIDLTGDTVQQNKVLSGYTFHYKEVLMTFIKWTLRMLKV